VTPPDLQTTVPTPTYAPGSPELIAFNEINAVRASLGLGLVAQNAYLDLQQKIMRLTLDRTLKPIVVFMDISKMRLILVSLALLHLTALALQVMVGMRGKFSRTMHQMLIL
jgi:hypothetical protein